MIVLCMVSMATIVMQSDPYPQNGHYPRKCKVICLQPTQIVNLCMHFYVYCPNDHIGTVLLFYFSNLIGQKHFLQNMGPRRVRLHRTLMVTSMLFLFTWHDHWFFFDSIKISVEINMYYVHLHNEDWNPKVYVPRKPCSHPMNTIAGSSMTGGTKNWTRKSKLWRQQQTSLGRAFIGWYMTATHTQNQWALHLQHQKCCKLLFTMSFIAVWRKNMDRNMRLQSCI